MTHSKSGSVDPVDTAQIVEAERPENPVPALVCCDFLHSPIEVQFAAGRTAGPVLRVVLPRADARRAFVSSDTGEPDG
jgi:hypothetical protein